jgi:uncharacterized protein
MLKSKPTEMENRVVLDTNILVSALIGNSYPKQIIYKCILDHKIIVCISPQILKEYQEVLNRPKFEKFKDFKKKALILLDYFEEIAEYYEPTIRLDYISDEADNRFLELALIAKAQYIVTGSFTDFDFSEYKSIKIVSPKYFYELCCSPIK